MALRVQYKPMGMKPSVTQPKVAGLGTGTSVPSVVAPKPVVPKVNYTPGGTPMGNNTGIVPPKIPSAPTLPPPVNEPMDLRRTQVPTPNDRPPPVAAPPPSGILPGEPNMPNKPGAQRPGPVSGPLDPYTPKPPVPAPTPKPGPLEPTPKPGPVEPLPKDDLNRYRRNETPEERIARLEAKLKARGGKDPKLEARIAALKKRLAEGGLDPDLKFKKQKDRAKNTPDKVQLDDDPDTWTPEMLAELAPPKGTVTQFYDNAKSSDKKTTDPLTGKPKKGDSDNDNIPDKNEVRQGESWEGRLKRLRKKLASGTGDAANIKQRIAEIEKKIKASGGTVPKEKPTPTNKPAQEMGLAKQQQKQESQVPQNDNKDVRGGENLQDRLARLKEKLKSAKTEQQKAQLRKRIAALEARIKVGDTKGKTNDQPGTPERPFRNRGVSYRPLGYGGSLRV